MAFEPYVTAFGDLLGGVFNAALQYDIVGEQNAYNVLLAKYESEMNRKLIQEQNEYNSPLNQIKRYQAAGLNPNLIYGNGSSSSGNQQTPAQYRAPSIQAPHIDIGDLGIGEAIQTYIAAKQLNKSV